jgi:hypothetical protein
MDGPSCASVGWISALESSRSFLSFCRLFGVNIYVGTSKISVAVIKTKQELPQEQQELPNSPEEAIREEDKL